MKEAFLSVLDSGDAWLIVIKVLATAILTGILGLVYTLLGKFLARCKHSKIRKHAKLAVEAAEQKFPNEGSKMGPEKMEYVMDYLAATFPKIKSNQYLYNIAEAAVFELNKEKEKENALREFIEKYGELPEELVEQDEPAVEEETSEITEDEEQGVGDSIEEAEEQVQNSVENKLASTTEVKTPSVKVIVSSF